MKHLSLLFIVALTLSFNTSLMASSDHLQPPATDRFEEVATKLQLSASQKAKIKALREETKKNIEPLFIKVRTIHSQLNELATTSVLDDDQLMKLVNEEQDVLGKIIKSRFLERRHITDVLTTEQKKTFHNLIKEGEKKVSDKHCG